jgi:hypothetical protein
VYFIDFCDLKWKSRAWENIYAWTKKLIIHGQLVNHFLLIDVVKLYMRRHHHITAPPPAWSDERKSNGCEILIKHKISDTFILYTYINAVYAAFKWVWLSLLTCQSRLVGAVLYRWRLVGSDEWRKSTENSNDRRLDEKEENERGRSIRQRTCSRVREVLRVLVYLRRGYATKSSIIYSLAVSNLSDFFLYHRTFFPAFSRQTRTHTNHHHSTIHIYNSQSVALNFFCQTNLQHDHNRTFTSQKD